MSVFRFTYPDSTESHAEHQLQILGPLVPISIDVHPDQAALMATMGHPPRVPQTGDALIDTGATLSLIDMSIARALALKQVGQTRFRTVHGAVEAPVFMALLRFPAGIGPQTMTVAGAELPRKAGTNIALLGRDLLRRGKLIYDGRAGSVELHLPD